MAYKTSAESEKINVKQFWEEASCGEELYLKGFKLEDYQAHAETRYRLEPEILNFVASFDIAGKKVLEIGVGLGADHALLAAKGADLYGIDLTSRAISHTTRRFELMGLKTRLQVSDAEKLPFESESFDAIYSWGVIHHSPRTDVIVDEMYRVLKKDGEAKIMIYHKYSLVGFMLWLRYALFRFNPLISLSEVYDKFLESPGTKAYSYSEARHLFKKFHIHEISTPLSHGDLLASDVGQRHRGLLLSAVKKIYPRKLLRALFPNKGLYMMLSLSK